MGNEVDKFDNPIHISDNRKKLYNTGKVIFCKAISMNGHHLILGELTDLISGETLKDTHDERYRQKIARRLIGHLGYSKEDIAPRRALVVSADDKKALLKIDFTVTLAAKMCMVLKYGPGSLVTRRRSVLAVSRLIAPYQVPVAVITNGQDAEIINGTSGEVTARGLDSIPPKEDLARLAADATFAPISDQQAEMESRILYCYEVDDSCECDEDICRL
jgi:Type I restriction enzyme R protein N terminus (HSDR_N)